MTDSFPPPNPVPSDDPLPPENPPPQQRDPLSFDELLAIVIALSTMGFLLWWGLTRTNGGFDFANLGSSVGVSTLHDDATAGSAPASDDESSLFGGLSGQAAAGDSEGGESSGSSASQGFFAGLGSPFWRSDSAESRRSRHNRGTQGTVAASGADANAAGTGTADGSAGEGNGADQAAGSEADGSAGPFSATAPGASESNTDPSAGSTASSADTSVPPPIDISDVTPESWAYPFVTALYDAGFVPDFPDGQFQPDKLVTRAELAAALEEAFAESTGQRQLTFKDIPENYWAAAAIDKAVKTDFMSGYPTGNFQPDETIPRHQVLVALVSGLRLDPPSNTAEILERYPDRDEIPDWAKEKIAAATQYGLVASHPDAGVLQPDFPATRADVAVMIHQALVQAGELEPIASEYLVQP